MKKLINNVEDVMKEQVEGLCLAHPELKLSEDPCYVYREDDRDTVALVSGGGSGHEPMHIGFIGEGMLRAACPGQVFSSPTPDQILECGKAVNTGKGVLLLIKNYTGDVLNFETAVELLHFEDIPVGSVTIDDDVAVKDSHYTAGRRGVGATVLIEKIVGAAAESGADLERLEVLARGLNNKSRSFGVALRACVVPAVGKPSFDLADDEIEFGVGIHGEPGIKRRKTGGVQSLVTDMLKELLGNTGYSRTVRSWNRREGNWDEAETRVEDFSAGDELIVMVNGMGATPASELYGAYREVHKGLAAAGFKVARNLVGNYCTALNMEGFSITLLKADAETLTFWDAPVNAPSLRWGQ